VSSRGLYACAADAGGGVCVIIRGGWMRVGRLILLRQHAQMAHIESEQL